MIALQGLGKVYRSLWGARAVRALDDFSLTVGRGEVVGIAGPNGAGKSTLISLLLGFLHPTDGAAMVDGLAPRAYVERYGVGYLPEFVALPPRWTVESTLRRSATLAGIPRAELGARAARMLEWLGLGEQRRKTVRQLSKGNLQRLGLAQALMGDHELVVLDEPTHGLDPVWTQRFRDIVRELRRPTRTILIASHNLDELERLADRVLILHQGRLQRVVDAHAALGSGVSATYRLRLTAPHVMVQQLWPDAVPVDARPHEWRIHGEPVLLSRALGELLGAGACIVSFTQEESRLESEFRVAMGGGR